MLDFLHSPYFNKRREPVQLFEVFIELSRNSKVADERKIYKNIFGERFNASKWRYLLSDLNLLIEEFFGMQKLRENSELKRQGLIENLSENGQVKFIRRHKKALLKEIQENPLQDSDALGIKFFSEEALYKAGAADDKREADTRLQQLSDSIDAFYLAKKLKYTCEMINRRNVLQVQYNLHLLDELNAILPGSVYLKIPAVSIYYHILQSLLHPDQEAHYASLKNSLLKSNEMFSKSELRDMFTFAQNYCIRRLNTGNVRYLEELFSNYEFLLKENIITDKGRISQFDFKNIVTIALRLHRYSWVAEFIKKYVLLLPKEERSNAELYNTARLFYAEGETGKALRLMRDVEFTDIYYHLDAKVLLIKIYYDTDSYESFMSVHVSFNNYLRRNKKVSGYQRLTYMNFLKLLLKMFNYKMFDKGNLNELKELCERAENIADINWLRERMEKLV